MSHLGGKNKKERRNAALICVITPATVFQVLVQA